MHLLGSAIVHAIRRELAGFASKETGRLEPRGQSGERWGFLPQQETNEQQRWQRAGGQRSRRCPARR